jgi:predicted Zn-dependent protease
MSISLRALAGFSAILCLWPGAAWANTPSQEESWETQVGQQRYMEYVQRGEIVPPQSPLYRTLDAVGRVIAAVANRQYFAPFHFILLNDQTPNAFSIPGGNVYVTTGLLSFLRNRDELAGVICHEVNHDIHHDMYAVFQATQGRSPQDPNVIAYERAAETNADRAGAYTCVKAGFNPWGMVWNFRQYRQTMGVSNNGGVDHPSDRQREADLVALFENHKATFGKFTDDIASATPLERPSQVAQRQYSPYAQYPSNSQYAQQYPQYPQQQYQPYPQQQYPQYSQQQYPQYPQQQYQPYPQQYQQYPYPPPPLPPCYPGC